MRFYFVCLFLAHHALVEGKFLALQDVSIASSGLSRSGGDLGEDTSRRELGIEGRVQSAVDLSALELLGNLGRCHLDPARLDTHFQAKRKRKQGDAGQEAQCSKNKGCRGPGQE